MVSPFGDSARRRKKVALHLYLCLLPPPGPDHYSHPKALPPIETAVTVATINAPTAMAAPCHHLQQPHLITTMPTIVTVMTETASSKPSMGARRVAQTRHHPDQRHRPLPGTPSHPSVVARTLTATKSPQKTSKTDHLPIEKIGSQQAQRPIATSDERVVLSATTPSPISSAAPYASNGPGNVGEASKWKATQSGI